MLQCFSQKLQGFFPRFLPLIVSIGPQFLQDAEALEFRKLGNVETVVAKQNVNNTVTVHAVQAVEVHRREVHSHESVDASRVVWLQEIAVSGNQQRERCCTQVEHTTFYVIVEIRIKPRKRLMRIRKVRWKLAKFFSAISSHCMESQI